MGVERMRKAVICDFAYHRAATNSSPRCSVPPLGQWDPRRALPPMSAAVVQLGFVRPMAERRDIDARREAYKHRSREELIVLIYSSVDDSAEQIAAKQVLAERDMLMVCPGCGSRIPSSLSSCPQCKRVFTSEFGRIRNFPGLVIEWIECPWCGKALKVCGQMDVGGDTPQQHRDRRCETLNRHRKACRHSDHYGERCARCGRTGINILARDTLKYHKGRVYGSECLPIVRSDDKT